MKRPKKTPDYKFIISEKDIIELLTALSNDDVEFVMDFFEDLEPIEDEDRTYTLEQMLANAGIVRASNE